jgi:hypothetical protein
MSITISEEVEALHQSLLELSIRRHTVDGWQPQVPYEKLHVTLELYTDVLGMILKDFDKRLKALEQPSGIRPR